MKLKTMAIIAFIALLLIIIFQYARLVDLPRFLLLPLGVLLGFLIGYVIGRFGRARK